MGTTSLYSDRTDGPKPRDVEVLPNETARALLGLVQGKIKGNWFAKNFPIECKDGNGIIRTDRDLLQADLDAIIPNLTYPLASKADFNLPGLVNRAEMTDVNSAKTLKVNGKFEIGDGFGLSKTKGLQPIDVTDSTIFDLLEYTAQRIALPREGRWHGLCEHHELHFDNYSRKDAQNIFKDKVNELLGRGGVIYKFETVDFAGTLQIQRIGTPEVRRLMADLQSNSGDKELDDLIIEARRRYLSYKKDERRIGLEKLWDAFERLKTIEQLTDDGISNKKDSTDKLLTHIADEPLRDVIEEDMKSLTSVGNQFCIRHHETNKHSVPVEGYDYLFARMSNVIITLLRASNRLAK